MIETKTFEQMNVQATETQQWSIEYKEKVSIGMDTWNGAMEYTCPRSTHLKMASRNQNME